MTRFASFALALAALVPLSGCIEIERVISLNPDLSGQAAFRVSVNFEPVARAGVQSNLRSLGTTGPIPEALVAEAVEEMSGTVRKTPLDKKALAASVLPPGVSIVSAVQEFEGSKLWSFVTG